MLFGASFLAVTAAFITVTYLQLDHELRLEKWERAHPDHKDWTLHGSYSDAEVNDIAGELVKVSLFASAPIAIAALLIGYYLARESTRPVVTLNEELQRIGPHSLSQRITLTETNPEMRAVQEQINGLLERLETSFRHLNEFSGKVAHELRTPLTYLRLQVERSAGKIEPDLAESLQDELKQLSDYVEQALLMTRAEQGRLSVCIEEIPIRELASDIMEVHTVIAAAEHRRVVFRCPEVSPVVSADPQRLRQVLHNLLTNALKHGLGNVRITIRQQKHRLTCTVANRVGDRRSSPGVPGTGFGLRLVTALCAAQGVQFRTRQSRGAYAARLVFSQHASHHRNTSEEQRRISSPHAVR